jgi:acetylornithine/N-succinyldiaminopimelate aminotransferase
MARPSAAIRWRSRPATPCSTSCSPGFFDRAEDVAAAQAEARLGGRPHPDVLAEVRGEGLLIGLKAVVPSGDLVDALRDQKLLTVGAGDNVVRFLPPLIVTEAEIEESVQRLERACVALRAIS